MKKTILITGASSGIGKASVKKFQAEGWNVIATMRSPENETELNELEDVLIAKLDVQDQQSIDKAVQAGLAQFGRIDVVLNNAGYGLLGTFESVAKDSIQRQYDVNVFGLFDVTRTVLPYFRKQKSGMFINISSVGGKITFPLTSLYHSTKFAVEGFSESVHYELAPLGIKVKIVEPGSVTTDFGGRSLDFQHDTNLDEYNDFVGPVMESFQALMDPAKSSPSELVAEVIYGAATDGSDQLRYRAGADAEQMLSARGAMSDEAFIDMMKQQLDIK
ncbi:NADP-dependent 3-hydroxy acid dehydrogenase YdfG [Dyadobacter jejuensis]|uniref:NADP-dependent 3-hydroxy acid dehydrogenase YdfG n=1 Tax=Dyadobacter jejuensis TaxID=1082580 RepID=A0A316AMX4_9BACT|nr:SDR family oxidoreductase [Dyadobacter jejuensis]PWJ58659.1 NADP-dependent 3-hydroxy acid dehydrogenase YdfG [Dyadobacter jejuensis]